MALIFLKPTTPSQKNFIKLNKKELLKSPIIKTKILGKKTSSGRNNSGKITIKHKGNGHKKKYRKINFTRTSQKSRGIVLGLEYDPFRNCNIASIYDFMQNIFFYILAPKKLRVGNIVESGLAAQLSTGNSLPLYKIPESSFIHNIAMTGKKKAQFTRAAGTFAILRKKTATHAQIKLSSRKEKFISLESYATLGILSNESYFLTRIGKAGRSRWLNKRPKVRGVAMNPVDHPNGGGEGKKSGKKLSPWK